MRDTIDRNIIKEDFNNKNIIIDNSKVINKLFKVSEWEEVELDYDRLEKHYKNIINKLIKYYICRVVDEYTNQLDTDKEGNIVPNEKFDSIVDVILKSQTIKEFNYSDFKLYRQHIIGKIYNYKAKII